MHVKDVSHAATRAEQISESIFHLSAILLVQRRGVFAASLFGTEHAHLSNAMREPICYNIVD